MSGRTPTEGIREFIDLIQASDLLQRFDDILEIIEGPIWIAKEKLNTVDAAMAAGVVSEYFPKLPSNYCSELKTTLMLDYKTEVECAQSILNEINVTISKLQSCLNAVSQRMLEGIKIKNPSINENIDLYDCEADCRNVLVYLKIKSSILKHYLMCPVDDLTHSNPFKESRNFEHDEETALVLLANIKINQRGL